MSKVSCDYAFGKPGKLKGICPAVASEKMTCFIWFTPRVVGEIS